MSVNGIRINASSLDNKISLPASMPTTVHLPCVLGAWPGLADKYDTFLTVSNSTKSNCLINGSAIPIKDYYN